MSTYVSKAIVLVLSAASLGLKQLLISNFAVLAYAGSAANSSSSPQLNEQAKRYAEVVCNVNRALVGGSEDQYDATNAFLAACPEETNGE